MVSSPTSTSSSYGHATGTDQTAASPRVKVKHDRQAHHPAARVTAARHNVPGAATAEVVASATAPMLGAILGATRRIPPQTIVDSPGHVHGDEHGHRAE